MPSLPANRLAELLSDRGVRLAKIAALCDVDQSTAYRWREGRSQIPDEKKFVLARFFGVSVPYLMGWDENGSPPQPDPDLAA